MSEQDYGIPSPTLSPFTVNLMEEEYVDEINSEHEKISLKLNELLADNDTDSTSINSEDFEEVVEEEQEVCNEKDEIIDNLEQTRFTPCVIVDFIEGEIKQCKKTTNLRQLRNLFGTWQVDRDAVNEVNGVLSKLGVCDSHFQFDNKYLHQSLFKQTKDFNEGIIQWRRCISCNKYITFFSRGKGCTIHSWYLNKKNIQVPCIGQYVCEALQSCPPLCNPAFGNVKRPHCICCLCYENLGGHIYHRSGIRGKRAPTCISENLHAEDITKGLEFIGKLLINIAQTGNNEIKKNILIKIIETLLLFLPLKSDSTTTFSTSTANTSTDYEEQEKIILNEPPSLFMIKTLFIKIYKEKECKKNVEINDFNVNISLFFLFSYK
jgi:hypothetical protein